MKGRELMFKSLRKFSWKISFAMEYANIFGATRNNIYALDYYFSDLIFGYGEAEKNYNLDLNPRLIARARYEQTKSS